MSVIQFVATGAEQAFGVVTRQDGEELHGSMPGECVLDGFDGRPAVGALGVLADDILGYTIIGSLPPGSWTVSTEIWIDMIRPLDRAQGRLAGRAHSVVPGAFSVGEVRDEAGRLIAECRQRGREVPDPPDFAVARTGFDLDGSLEVGTGLAGVLGLRDAGGPPALPVEPRWENPRGVLHGGISLAATEWAATRSRVQEGSELPTVSLHIVHTRPVPSGVDLELRATTRHAGRTLWVTDVDAVWNGKVCATTRVSAQA